MDVGLDAQMRAQRAVVAPFLGEALQRGIVGGQVDHQSDELVAAAAGPGGEAPALEAQRLA